MYSQAGAPLATGLALCPRAVEELQRAYQVVAGVHRESVYMDHQDKTPKLSEFLDKLEEMIKEVKAEMQEDRS